MNKQKWLECIDLQKMLNQITDQRKLRLFACASVRQVWHLLKDEKTKNAVIVAEKFADGLATKQQLNAAWVAARSAAYSASNAAYSAAYSAVSSAVYSAAYPAAYSAAYSAVSSAANAARYATRKDQYNLLREVVNPYHIPTIYPKVSIEIAQNIYKTQDFTGTPILADALEEDGIMDQELLEHLRLKDHVRGCWAIDVIK